MSATILGISAFYHDSAAAIVSDGEIVAAAQEERFTRKKHDARFPRNAVNYCLGEAFIEPEELDAVVFYDHPVLTLDRVVRTVLSTAPASEDLWVDAARSVLGRKLFLKDTIRKQLGVDVDVLVSEHHASHGASAFFPSPFEEAAILTMDGVGEWATTTLGYGSGNSIRIEKQITFPHSVGLLYSAFTSFCGFKVNSGEYKLMGLAPYGEPIWYDSILENLIDLRPDGSFRLNMEYFGFLDSKRMTNSRFDELFQGGARAPESEITKRETDLAASVQKVTEEVVLRTARHLRETTGMKSLVMAGGVALNCVANGLVAREKIFEKVWIQPAAGDAGGALGAALLASHERFGIQRRVALTGGDSQKGSYLGSGFTNEQVRAFLESRGIPHLVTIDRKERANLIARALADGRIVGLFTGRMEFGPRALGNRSILGDPRGIEKQSEINVRIKFRESFRPFAPAVLAERASEFFDSEDASPYMLLVCPVNNGKLLDGAKPVKLAEGGNIHSLAKTPLSTVPAVTHVDLSARVQTVDRNTNTEFYEIIKAFEELTGCPLVVNTSFNIRGEPIVCTPQDAYKCFVSTGMDVLVLENTIVDKEIHDLPELEELANLEFELD